MTAPLLPVPIRPAPRLLGDEELARRCGLHPDLLRRFVALGLVPAVRDARGALWFDTAQVAAVARLLRLRAGLPLNCASLGLVVDLLDRVAELETALRVRGRTEPVRSRAQQPTAEDEGASARWT